MVYRMRLSFSHLMQFIPPKIVYILLKLNSLFYCFFRLFCFYIICIPLLLGTKWMFYVKNVFWCLWWCYCSHLMTKVKTQPYIQGLQLLPLCFCHVNKEPMHCCWHLIFHAGQVLSYHWSRTWRCWCYRLINGDLMMPIKISRTRYTPQILR